MNFEEYTQYMAGIQVRKRSGKPFKSGKKIATVKKVTVNPNSNLPAFEFVEDTSVVDIKQCLPWDHDDRVDWVVSGIYTNG